MVNAVGFYLISTRLVPMQGLLQRDTRAVGRSTWRPLVSDLSIAVDLDQ